MDYIQNKSDINKILVRIGTNVAELKDSPSHTIADQLPEYESVGTRNLAARRAGHVIWPSGVRSAIVVAAEHSPREPEIDWWSSDSKGGTLRDGACELAESAGLHDQAGFFDPHDRTIEHFLIGISFVILLLAEHPLEGPASERILRTDSVTGHVAAIARVKVDRTCWLELSLYKDPSKTDTRSKLWRDQEVVFADHPQASQMGGILEESPPVLDLVRQRKGVDPKFFTQPDPELSRLQPQHTVARSKALDLHTPPIECGLGCWMDQSPHQN
ncbi:MAG: hypothetical protein E3J21_18000 [Anaerolineales bacterium]|nr:MAG: hypothetical protein E3J21_18000 [Anaerolineales bacterium]